MNIIIIANFPCELDGSKSKGRFLYLSELLCESGHQVEMIVSDFDHSKKKHRSAGSINFNAYKTKITALHEPGYPNNISFKRLWSHYIWGRNVGYYLYKQKCPDVVYCAVPSLTAGIKSAKYCESQGIPFVVDVQDLWPEAFQMAIKNRLLQKVLVPISWYVNQVYKSADRVIAVSNTYIKRVLSVNKKTKFGLCVFLGNDGKLFDESINFNKVDKDNNLKLAYIGTLGYSYDIPCIIKALNIYQTNNSSPRIKFIVMGDGSLKSSFEIKAKELGIDCEFTGYLSYPDMVSRLSSCDIVVNPIVAGSAASIINKVGDYALSGLPVINTQECPEYRNLINEYCCGINCNVGDDEDVARALETLANDESLRKEMGINARRLGEEKFDRRNSYKKIVELIESLQGKYRRYV